MKKLVSKFQLFYYERGEFGNIGERSLVETITLLQHPEWQMPPSFLVVGMDAPSFTIEGADGSYLKIGLYYYGKFSIYLLDEHDKLFLKVVDTLQEAALYVEAFFDGRIKEREFLKQDYVFRKRKRFATGDFKYRVRIATIFRNMYLPVLMFLVLTGIMLLSGAEATVIFPPLIGFLLLLSSVHILLFFNYLHNARQKVIQISRGHDIFCFGTENEMQTYDKREIRQIRKFSNTRWSKCPWSEFCHYEIEFKNGTMIAFNNLLIGEFVLERKFEDQHIADRYQGIPFIRKNRKEFLKNGTRIS